MLQYPSAEKSQTVAPLSASKDFFTRELQKQLDPATNKQESHLSHFRNVANLPGIIEQLRNGNVSTARDYLISLYDQADSQHEVGSASWKSVRDVKYELDLVDKVSEMSEYNIQEIIAQTVSLIEKQDTKLKGQYTHIKQDLASRKYESVLDFVEFQLDLLRSRSTGQRETNQVYEDEVLNGQTIDEVSADLESIWLALYKKMYLGEQKEPIQPSLQQEDVLLPPLIEKSYKYVEKLSDNKNLNGLPGIIFQRAFKDPQQGYEVISVIAEQYLLAKSRAVIENPNLSEDSNSNLALNDTIERLPDKWKQDFITLLKDAAVQPQASSTLGGNFTVGLASLIKEWIRSYDF